ncbi:MAG TPA: TIGR03663 family protein [Anaerolineae bacterium]|nr:TIGR03663 family protein [Anaerolineae bacterium]HQH37111.1 TIGR03663 family protein [Anaerolineae bacterium]
MFGERLKRWEIILYILILVTAIVSRFYMLGDRAISHDESIHTKFSWNLYAGQGFRHNPMMHGPLLFEVTAFVYFLFGPNDFTARIYPALTGIVLVMTPLLFRKWLGRHGALAASLLLLLSPSISYYSRYIRHDVSLMLTATLLLWTVLKYLDDGNYRWLYGMAACFSLMHATKEASYIYIAIFGALMFLPFAWQVFATRWKRSNLFIVFVLALILALLLGGVFMYSFRHAQTSEQILDDVGNTRMSNVAVPVWGRLAAGMAFLTLLGAVVIGYYGVGEEKMRQIRLFDVLMALGTLTLPLGSAFLIKFVAGLDMSVVYDAVISGNLAVLPASTVLGIGSVVLLSLLGSIALGVWWNKEHWPIIALIHYAIFFVLYTTFFTWGWGALSGLVGGLAYWLAQQGIKRGGQPMYYYFLLAPLYEYLAVLFSAVGGVGALVHFARRPFGSRAESSPDEAVVPPLDMDRLFPLFLLGWTLLSWVGYTLAGEKMPWLVVHIILPSIFLAGWGLGKISAGVDWQQFVSKRGWLLPLALTLTMAALTVFGRALVDLRAAMQPGVTTAGPSLTQLEPFGTLIGGSLGVVAFGGLFIWLSAKFSAGWIARVTVLLGALFLALLTTRDMTRLNYITYDLATEMIVYAHGTPDIKVALRQIEDISWRVAGAPHDVKVAYGEKGSWPLTWYMIDYPNNYFYGTTPDAAKLLECPVVIAGSAEYGVVEPILGSDYIHFDYKYLWWPLQDYFDLTIPRIREMLADPTMRAALWDIVWKRDYTRYAQAKNPENPFTLQKWPYREEFRLYVRRDVAQEVWSYRLGDAGIQTVHPQATQLPDPYQAGARTLPLVSSAALPGAAVRGIAVAADGTLYAADTTNHRIWHITPQGALLETWGEFGVSAGQFNEPWGIAVAEDGTVYVADTWNHRIQKFDAQGRYLTAWGTLAQATVGDAAGYSRFYGPRGIAIGPTGMVYVTDTGNKRVQVFDADGNFLREFGGGGTWAGQMDEPVGIAVDATGTVFVADTWNRRVQVFSGDAIFLRQWSVPVWGGDNPDEKPFLALGKEMIYVGDPVHQRVLAFTTDGAFRWALSNGESGLNLTFPEGLAVSGDVLYVADTYSSQILGFSLP